MPGKTHIQAVTSAADLPPGPRFEREHLVLCRFPVSRATWWRGVKSGKYPQPIKLDFRTTVWRSEDIDALIASTWTAGGEPVGT